MTKIVDITFSMLTFSMLTELVRQTNKMSSKDWLSSLAEIKGKNLIKV